MSTEVLVDGIYFTFPNADAVHIFDDSAQYNDVKGWGIKGCDIVLLKNDELWLIEVKDYTYPGASQPQDLVATLASKISGTLGMLHIWSRSENDGDAYEFARRCAKAKRIHAALHVEPKDGGRKEKQVQAVLMPLQGKINMVGKSMKLQGALVSSTFAPNDNAAWTSRRDPTKRAAHQD
ncbi:hypothetical protein, partial [Nesterenkonia aethiopica]